MGSQVCDGEPVMPTNILVASNHPAERFHSTSVAKVVDVKSIAFDVLRHRVLLTYEAEAEDVTPESIVQRVLDAIEVP